MNRAPRPRKIPVREPASVPTSAVVPAAVPVLTDATAWMATRDWQPFGFQRDVWDAIAAGDSGLLHATTGAGKTYAVWLGALQALDDVAPAAASTTRATPAKATRKPVAPPLSVLWITPMRALAADTLRALQEPLPALAPTWTVAARTGDTPQRPARRAKQAVAHRAGHHARKPEPAAGPGGRTGRAGRRAHGGG